MLHKIYSLLLLTTSVAFSQTITVDDASYTATNLAELLLDGSCIDPTNVSYSDSQSVAYFNQNSSTFPLNEGVIIRTGTANLTAGSYTDTNLSSQVNSNGDADLENISTSTGQTATITDTAFLQFDFTPIASDFNFNFVFASNEYGQYQCGFSDVFAFLLTDLTTNTTTNLAIVPSTTTPVTVATIRDNAHNSGCTSENAALFSTYNVTNPGASTLNMRGHTEVLNASSVLTVNNPYRIRLVIGDYNNPDYDSAVFIESGSFTTPLNIGADATICAGNSINVTTNLDTVEFTHTWTLNGAQIGGTANNIDITQAGTYVVTAVKGSCTLTDEIIITDLTFNTPDNLTNCDDGSGALSYDLSVNDETLLGIDPAIYDVVYFATQADIATNTPIVAPNIANYTSAGNETIYIKLFNIQSNTFCDVELSFDLLLSTVLSATEPIVTLCDTDSVDLLTLNPTVLGGLNPADYTVAYYINQNDALNGTNPFTTNGTGTINFSPLLINSPVTLWVSLYSNTSPDCIDVIPFNIVVNPLPPVSNIPDVIECSQFTLPAITHGNYYDAPDGPNGTGTMLNNGDVIIDSGTYYIYNGPDANGCFNESSFTLTFIDEYSIAENYCGTFSVPTPPVGSFYTAIDGPSGTGTLIPSGTVFTTSFTIYYYAVMNGSICKNEPFPINIHPLPPVDTSQNIVNCLSYTLPPLTNGAYFYDIAGTNPIINTTILPANTTPLPLPVYIINGPDVNGCVSTSFFTVTVIDSTQDVTACGSYTLPALTTGNYFTGPAGSGTQIPVGTVINTIGNTDVYVYAPTSTAPNCTDNLKFTVTIIENPPVDTVTPPTNLYCVDAPYVLQPLTNGTYYNGPNGTGSSLAAGSSITAIGMSTIYVYNQVQWGPNPSDYCYSETSFTIETRDLPLVDNYTDVYRCDPYTLQPLTNGTYYDAPDGPNGTGAIIPAGTVISTTQTIYIYNQYTDLTSCISETVITVYILGVDVGDRLDVMECDTYTLPTLDTSVVNMHYYSASGGDPADEILPANFTYNTVGTYTVYVYADNGDRFVCTDEDEFTITISATPVLSTFSNLSECGTYTLPALDNTNYDVAYYTAPNGVGLITAANYTITAVGTQTIYVYATAFDNTNCNDEEFFTLEIKAIPPVDTLPNALNCVDDPFQLPTLTNGDYFTGPGRTGTQLAVGNFISAIGTTTIYINNLVNGCDNETSFDVEIRALPTVDSFATINECDSYTLPILTNGTYYTETDGPTGTGTILAVGTVITTTQTVYIYNDYADLTTCISETSFDINIVGIQVDAPGNVTECDSYLLPTLDTTVVNQAYYSASGGNAADLITDLTVTGMGAQTIYVYAEINSPIFCSSEESFTVTLNNSPILPPLPNQETCITFTLPVLNTASYNAAYYTAPGGNNADLIDVANYTITNEGVNTIYVYASNLTAPNCFTETSFTVTIYPLQELDIADGVICIDPVTGDTTQPVLLESNIPIGGNGFTINWYFGGALVHTGLNYLATQVGTYTIETIKNTPDIPPLCNYATTTVEVTQSSIATATVSVSTEFEDEGVLIVNVTSGFGVYEYQLDNGIFQTSNEFHNVSSGDHIITVRDVSSANCGQITLDATIIIYPKFFTPNGDGFNDSWNIIDLDDQPQAEIYIFDRFGKFIKFLRPNDNGWDGLYNGRPLPATDYWFKVLYKNSNGEDKEFRSHFSLKR